MKTVKEILEVYQHSLIKADDIKGQTYQSKADTRRPAKFPPEKDIPNVLTLVRKAIRVFPDNQKIALYYSYALDKYLSVPYGPNNKAMGIHLSEDQKTREQQNIQIRDPNLYKYYLKNIKGKKGKPVTDADVVAKMDTVTAAQHGKAFRKAGQLISKDFNPATAGAAFGTLMRGGYEAGKRGVKKVVRKISSPSPKSFFPVVEEYSTPSDRFKSNLKHIKKQNQKLEEGKVLDTLDTVADVAVPFYGAGKKALKGDFKGAAKSAAVDAALLAVGGPLARGLVKGVSKGYKAIKASRAAKAATKAADAAGRDASAIAGKLKPKLKVTPKPKPKSKKGGFLSGLAAGSLIGGGGNGSSSYDAAKAAVPKAHTGDFTPGGRAGVNVNLGGEARGRSDVQFGLRQITARKQPMQESSNFDKIKMIAESKKSDVIVFEDVTITINNRIAKKIVNLHESLNKDNKQKVENMLSEDVSSFRKIINFALRH